MLERQMLGRVYTLENITTVDMVIYIQIILPIPHHHSLVLVSMGRIHINLN